MGPIKQRLNTTGPGVWGMRLNQSKRKITPNSILGSAAKNTSVLYGKIKRNSHNVRRNNIALAKALNVSKQKISELTTLVMQYRERAHAAERKMQQFELLRQDLRCLLSQYDDGPSMMPDESSDTFQESSLQISLPQKTENAGHLKSAEYHPVVKEARTQLVNPMVQGLSINKVKVRLERINDIPRPRGQSLPDSGTSPESDQRNSMPDVSITTSPVSPVDVFREDGVSSPEEDITVDLSSIVQNLGNGEQFSTSLRVPSLTLQRLSAQDIQRTTSAAYMAETLLEVSSVNQSPHDQSAAVQLGESMFPVEGDRISSRQSAHETVDKPRDSVRTSESPKKKEVEQHTTVENPLEGTSWMYDTNRVSRRITVRRRKSTRKPAKRESTKRRYSVKNLAAKDDRFHPLGFVGFSPPTADEVALQDMSLTLCLPLPGVACGPLLDTTPPSAESPQDVLEVSVPVTDEDLSLSDLQVKVTKKSPTVAVTRLDANVLRLSVAESSSFTSEDACVTSPAVTSPGGEVTSEKDSSVPLGDKFCMGDGIRDSPPRLHLANNHEEASSSIVAVVEIGPSGDGCQETPVLVRKVSESVKVVLKRVDNETDTAKPVKRSERSRRNVASKEAPVMRLPRRQVKKVGPGAYKEPSLGSKLRR